MARPFTPVWSKLWSSKRFRELPGDQARLLYLYLLTGPHQTAAGTSKAPTGYICSDLGWTDDAALANLKTLEAVHLIERDLDTSEVRITNWFAHCPPTNPNHYKGIISASREIQSERLRDTVIKDAEEAEFKRKADQKAKADEKQRATENSPQHA